MKKSLVFVVLGLSLLLLLVPAAASAEKPPQYWIDETKLPFGPLPGFEDTTRDWGVYNKAGYRMEVPANWNGVLVMWAHGYRGTGLELTVDNHPLREFLIPSGYAWAASSYSKNDYNVAQGVKDTHALADLFREEIGEPSRIYLVGASMGGHVTAVSVEQYPNFYDGAMPFCGVVGDFELFDFFLDFNVAAQQIALGTSQFPVDPSYPLTTALQIKANLEAVPGGWPVALNAEGMAFKQLVELRSGGDRPNFDEAWYFWNTFPSFASPIPGNFLFDLGALDGTMPGRPGVVVDNSDVVYQTDFDPALNALEQELNENVARVTADPSARKSKGLSNVPAVTGRIPVPVLSLHNLGDMFVPFHNEIAYAQDAADQGRSHMLVQRAIRGVSHCDMTPSELITGFTDLVQWVELGIKPAGDVILDPAAVAAPDYGCQFTDDPAGLHVLATPCP